MEGQDNNLIVAVESVNNVKIVWKIDNFSRRTEQNGEKLVSPKIEITGPNGDKQNWAMELYPRGVNHTALENISLFLRFNGEEAEVMAKVKFSIMGEETHEKEMCIRKYGKNHGSWGWPKFIERDFLIDGDSQLLPNDRLTILCHIKQGDAMMGENPISQCQLIANMAKLWETKIYADCVLVTVEDNNKEIRAHKGILGCRSPVFAAMFQDGTIEAQENRVLIKDIQADVLEQMLRFIYTDHAPNVGEMATELLAAADKYQIQGLKLLSEQSLSKSMTNENACELLILADLHSAAHLKSQAIQFIESHFDEVHKSDGWKVLTKEHAHLVVELLEAVMASQQKKC